MPQSVILDAQPKSPQNKKGEENMDTKINFDTTLIDSKTGECIEIEKGTKIVSPQRQEEIKEYAYKKNK